MMNSTSLPPPRRRWQGPPTSGDYFRMLSIPLGLLTLGLFALRACGAG